jgi:hypothetical protein
VFKKAGQARSGVDVWRQSAYSNKQIAADAGRRANAYMNGRRCKTIPFDVGLPGPDDAASFTS